MSTYRLTYDVWNSARPDFPARRVTMLRAGATAREARQGVATIYVSADGRLVNATGRVGPDGAHYPEWSLIRQRKVTRVRHIISATVYTTGENSMMCGLPMRYSEAVAGGHVVGNYSGKRGATCAECVATFDRHEAEDRHY